MFVPVILPQVLNNWPTHFKITQYPKHEHANTVRSYAAHAGTKEKNVYNNISFDN